MKLSDFVVEYLANAGIEHAFVLSGGAVAHLIDSVALNKKMNYVCVQHEQAGSMAAEGYARVSSSRLGLAMATSGPGATNLLTGIACAYFDSVSVIYVTGQVNTFESKKNLGIRQMGFQETDIVTMAKPITKWAEQVTDPLMIKSKLCEALYYARSGRPGPVLIDIPFDLQKTDIDVSALKEFKEEISVKELSIDYKEIFKKLESSSRPVLLVGGGVRCAAAQEELNVLVDRLKIPVVTSWSAVDLVSADHDYYRGQIGVYGARAANFTVQNADFVISVGSRLDSRQTGGKYGSFGRAAYKVVVDIDESELSKNRVQAQMPVVADAKKFISGFLPYLSTDRNEVVNHSAWLKQTAEWVKELPVYDKSVEYKKTVNPYKFFDLLSAHLQKNALIYLDTGATLTWGIQGLRSSGQQRVMSAFGNSPMGYALPAAIGGAFARPDKQIISVSGDGGYQLNIQELQTIKYYNLPLKIIIMNNYGYGIIKQFQSLYLDGREHATGEGYSVPNFGQISAAYGIQHSQIKNDSEIINVITKALATNFAEIIEVNVDPNQLIQPKLGWGKPIEDQIPLLSREEFAKYMLIPEFDADSGSTSEIN